MLISILLYNHKQLTECILEVEDIEAKVECLQKKEELTTEDRYFINRIAES
jgi:hypothetical protein